MSDHLMDIATQQLVTIARTTAYNCDEQHEYMKGAGGNDWLPHKWVVEAMRAAVTIRNTQAEDIVREELHQARAELEEWKKRCQYNADTAQDVGRECDTLRAKLAERDAQATERAAKWVERRLNEYVQEHGIQDPETGTVEFPGDGEEYVEELDHIAQSIRALSASAEPQVKS